jgi:hypothetical protein
MIPLILFKYIPWQFYFQNLNWNDFLLLPAALVAAFIALLLMELAAGVPCKKSRLLHLLPKG